MTCTMTHLIIHIQSHTVTKSDTYNDIRIHNDTRVHNDKNKKTNKKTLHTTIHNKTDTHLQNFSHDDSNV